MGVISIIGKDNFFNILEKCNCENKLLLVYWKPGRYVVCFHILVGNLTFAFFSGLQGVQIFNISLIALLLRNQKFALLSLTLKKFQIRTWSFALKMVFLPSSLLLRSML